MGSYKRRNYYKKYDPSVPTEYNECLALVAYLRLKNIRFAHLDQEVWTPSFKQKFKAKALGVVPGVPDYLILLPNKILFIEMKRR